MFDPVEFLGRLAVLVPRPRINLMLYHGVLGPRAAWRGTIVRRETSVGEREVAVADDPGASSGQADAHDAASRHARGYAWADMIARAPPLLVDVPDGSTWDDESSGFDACS